MSGALAIAAVTAVLKDLLNNGVIANDLASLAGNTVRVTSRPPDLLRTGAEEQAGLNLFLYHATPNTALRNAALPSMNARGDRLTNPPLALDLHYLLTAYGKEEYQAEILMGYAMQLLHETPVLTRQAIRTSLAAIPSLQVSGGILPPAYQALAAADLADQIELVKLTPEPLGVEELSKLWSAFQANHFRLTAGYGASVVLIEGRRTTRATLPVREPRLYVLPLVRPQIDEVIPDVALPGDTRITSASTIHLNGTGLRGDVTRVQIGDTLATPATVTDTRITVPLAALTELRAGVQAAQVVHQLRMGEPPVPHRGVESNVMPFVLHPRITLPATHALGTGALPVEFAPRVGRAQRVTLHLHERNAPDTRPARAYSIAAPRDNGIGDAAPSTDRIPFPLAAVEPGDYLAYARVDGAESPLRHTDGRFDAPAVTVTA